MLDQNPMWITAVSGAVIFLMARQAATDFYNRKWLLGGTCLAMSAFIFWHVPWR